MILRDESIHAALKSGRIGCAPEPLAHQIQPASLDLRLGTIFYKFLPGRTHGNLRGTIDVTTFDAEHGMYKYEEEYLEILPGEFILGSTVECITLPADLRGCLHGRSSLARLGLVVHVTAGYIDPGFSGSITLEFANLGPRALKVPKDTRIAQLSFEEMDGPAAMPYGKKPNSKYQDQKHTAPSRIGNDWKTTT